MFVGGVDRNQQALLGSLKPLIAVKTYFYVSLGLLICNQWLLLRAVSSFDSSFFCPQNVKTSVGCCFFQLFVLRITRNQNQKLFLRAKTIFLSSCCHFFAIRLRFSRLFLYLSNRNWRNPTMHKTICQI